MRAIARLLESSRFAAKLLQLARHPMIDFFLRRKRTAACGIGFLPANERPLMESAPEVLRRLELVIEIRDEAGTKSRGFVHFGQRRLRLRNRSPAWRNTDEVALDVAEIAAVERVGAKARVDRSARAQRWQ